MRGRAVASLLPVAMAVTVLACGPSEASGGGSVSASGAWVRAAPAGAMSAAYLTITNGTPSEDALVGVSTPAAGMATLHVTTTDNGMVGMHPVDRIDLPAGETVALEPRGYHVMLGELADDLASGSVVTITLAFEHAAPLSVQAEVRAG